MKTKLLSILFLAATMATASAAPYIGASAGYLVDTQEGIFSFHAGTEFAKSGTASHQVELEFAFTSERESGAKLDLVPILANYRLSSPLNPKTEFFVGGGLGLTRTKVSFFGFSDSGNAFTAQAFTGVAFNATPNVAITLGARYLWIGKVELFGFKERVGDDVSVELGFRFRL